MGPGPAVSRRVEDQLHFETLISDLSARLVAADDEAFPHTIESAIGEVVQFFGADRGGILGVSRDRREARVMYAWYGPGLAGRVPPDFDFAEHTPWAFRLAVEERRPFVMERVEDLPPEAARDRETFQAMGTRSTLSIPIAPGPHVEYLMTIAALQCEVRWPTSYVPRLQLLGEIFANTVERRRSREAFRRSEARLDLATKSAGVVPWDIDVASGRIWTTAEGKEVYGWPRDADVTLDLFYRTVHPDDVAAVRAHVAAADADRPETLVEYRIVMPGGGVKWIDARARYYEGREAERPHLAGISIDVTARKQLEAERLSAAARLQAAVDVALLGFYEVAEGERVTYVDARGRDLFGMTTEVLADGRALSFWADHLHPGDRQWALELHDQLNDGRRDRATISYRYLHPTRGLTWIQQVTHVIVRDEARRARVTIGVMQNVTEERSREEALRASEEVNRATFEQAGVGIAHVSPAGEWLRVNDRLCAILGYSRDELLGTNFQRFTHPDDVGLSLDYVRKVLAGGPSPYSIEKRYLRKDGAAIWANLTVSLVRDADGGPKHFISVIADISERKRAEETLVKAHAEVQRLRDQLERENVYLRQETRALKGAGRIVGQSRALRAALLDVEKVAPTQSTVLLLGETGTGKELFAAAIHEQSPRRARAMVQVNCAAIPVTLIESELFGRERGAYTGALSRQIGRFELANGSTIFLDEIGDLPMDIQVKLLRVLQERQIERLGNPRPVPVDVRIIAATHHDLERDVREGKFREDLYYRLSVFPVRVPALRERREDIPLLVESLIEELAGPMGKRIASVSRASLDALVRHDWPGNVRELRNAVERALILASGPVLHIDIPGAPRPASTPGPPEASGGLGRDELLGVLEQVRWRVRGKGGAAERLGLKPTTLESRMAKLGIRRP